MADAELVARLGDAVHYEILIEDAIESCGLIIAPDGISGNLRLPVRSPFSERARTSVRRS